MTFDLNVAPRPAGSLGMGGHHSARAQRDEWLTPPHVLAALGAFDLDPCAAINAPWPTAAKHYTVADDGLSKPWSGRVWLNPPYGAKAGAWVRRLAEHGNGIALLFARTETAIYFPWIWERAQALFFFRGRLNFHFANGARAATNSGAPSVLVAYGDENARCLTRCALLGKVVML